MWFKIWIPFLFILKYYNWQKNDTIIEEVNGYKEGTKYYNE